MSTSQFDILSARCSKLTAKAYSTSFTLAIRCLAKKLRDPIFSIYGFVRFADEIVDTFHEFNKRDLFERFREETQRAISDKISLNPILNSFQHTVHKFQIEKQLYDQFLRSMEMDLDVKQYDQATMDEYLRGSAAVVGLMSLRVFTKGNDRLYEELKVPAMKMGSAFQKVNFLRDLDDDYHTMGRSYFPNVDLARFDEASKRRIEDDVLSDFNAGFAGIKKLPKSARLGVYVAYLYYMALFRKIKGTPCDQILKNRIRIDNSHKISILAYSYFKHHLNLI